jgi:hypothetical protein
MDSIEFAWLLSLVLAVLAGVQTLRLWGQRAVRSLRARSRNLRARRGERQAETLLRRLGYRVVERQPRRPWAYTVDGEANQVELRADLLVSRHGRSWAAEVKTGTQAPRLDRANTRRQLLEYRLGFDVDGVLLVDAEQGQVHEVVFELPPAPAGSGSRSRWAWLLCGLALGAGAVWAALTHGTLNY